MLSHFFKHHGHWLFSRLIAGAGAAVFAFFIVAHAALAAPGVQQSASQTATIAGTVVQNDRTPIPGAGVKLIGPAVLSTKTDAHGVFQFSGVPHGNYLIAVDATSFGHVEQRNITVNGDTTVVIQYQAIKTLATVTIHPTGAHINVTSASIASVNPTQYAFQGNPTWRELLSQVPGVTVGGGEFGGGHNNVIIPDSPFQPAIISINGAQPYETSTTLDGMPLSNYTFSSQPGNGVDLSALPMPLFETADVVRGPGANAPSIVDSVGGSFVLHPPGFVPKNSFEGSFSNDPYGGYLSDMRATLRSGKLSATMVYGFNNSPGPLGSGPFFGGLLSPATINGNAVASGGFVAEPPNPVYGTCGCIIQSTLIGTGGYQSTAWSAHNGGIGLSYQLTPSITAQTFYAGSQDTAAQADFLYTFDFTPGAGYNGPISSGSYPGRPIDDTVTPILQSGSLFEEKLTAYIGGASVLRLAALQNYTYGRQLTTPTPPSAVRLSGTAMLCPSGTIPDNISFSGLCGPPPAGPFTIAPTQTAFNGQNTTVTFTPVTIGFASRATNDDLLADYEAPVGPKSSVGVSFVKSTNSVTDRDFESFVFSNGSFTLNLGDPVLTQTTNELRIHVEAPLSKAVMLDASYYIAGATYHVLDPNQPAGTTCNSVNGNGCTWADSNFNYSAPRLGATWRVNPDTVVRAAAGGGFALPPIFDLVGLNGVPICTSVNCTIFLTNVNLQPEKSFGFDFGTDIRLRHDTVISADVYRTDVYGQFFRSVNLLGLDPIHHLPLYAQEYLNLAHSRFEGINMAVRDDVPRGVYWNAGLGLTRGYIINVPAGFYNQAGMTCNFKTGNGCQNTYALTNQNFDGEFQSTQPYANGSAEFGYRWADKKYASLQANYQGNNNAYFQPAFVSFDAHTAYALNKNFALLLTMRNITGIHGQYYQFLTVNPNLIAPSIAGLEFPLYPIPVGPRALIVTTNVKF